MNSPPAVKPPSISLIPPLWVWLTFSVWVAILLAMNMVWGTPLRTGYLADSDDYLRMSRVFDLLDHKNYPSWQQPRLGPGGMVENGWSRLIDGPLWLLMVIFGAVMPRAQAALWTVTVFPALALLAFLFAAIWYVRSNSAGNKSLVSVVALFVVCIMWDALHQFMPGRVTHHDWQIVLTVLAYASLARLCAEPESRLWPALGGLFFGTGLGIGADIVPWLVLGTSIIGFHFLIYGERYEQAASRFGIAVALSTGAWFIILVSPERFFVAQCDTISPTYLSFAIAVAVFWGIVTRLPKRWKSEIDMRALSSGAVALLITGALYHLWPRCFYDIYGITDPLVRNWWLNRVVEAQSIIFVANGSKSFIFIMMMPVALATAGALWAAREDKMRRIWWLALALVLMTGTALAFWQFRILDYVQAIAIAPLGWLIMRWVTAVKNLPEPQRLRMEAMIIVIAAACLLFPASHRNQAIPATPKGRMQERCSVRDAASALNALPPPQMIAAFVEEGSEIIYRTPHWALAGPYHRDQEGIGAVYRIFTAPDAHAARKVIDKYKVTVLMVCPAHRRFWDSITPQKSYFAGQLLDGKAPEWLSRIPSESAVQIYRVSR
ncbi:MAG TPA: hypothetical protein VL625_07915 [Patescibacteria group bacterium]|nr:hypothetical protein [Patescibacteria group bacterium]